MIGYASDRQIDRQTDRQTESVYSETPIKTYNNVASMGATKIIMINNTYIINIYIHIQNM